MTSGAGRNMEITNYTFIHFVPTWFYFNFISDFNFDFGFELDFDFEIDFVLKFHLYILT